MRLSLPRPNIGPTNKPTKSAHDMAPTAPSIPTGPAVTDKIAFFRGDLARFSVRQMVQRHITYGTCHILDENHYLYPLHEQRSSRMKQAVAA